MQSFCVELKEKYPFLQGGSLEGLVMEYPFDGEVDTSWKRPALIVVPGGGYGMVSKREGWPIANEFYAKGFQVFVLTYLCAPDGVRYPEQLLEEAAAVDYVRQNAEKLHVNTDEVFLVGFSAGGHLVGNLAVEHQNIQDKAGVALNCKPTAVGLCYPVISHELKHQFSHENLLNGYTDEAKEELYKTLNLDQSVSAQTPPAFLWTTATDNVVPAQNTLIYAMALANQGIDYEVHIYPEGAHGLSTCSHEVNIDLAEEIKRAERWLDDCVKFFRRYIKEKY